MIQNVKKKDGSIEPFDAGKIKQAIILAGKEAGLEEQRVDETGDVITRSIVKTLEGREKVPTSEIRERILAMLDAMESKISEAWRAHEQNVKNK